MVEFKVKVLYYYKAESGGSMEGGSFVSKVYDIVHTVAGIFFLVWEPSFLGKSTGKFRLVDPTERTDDGRYVVTLYEEKAE